ncbi:alpha/beta hydrolase [Kitasatospora sp. NPDC050543]|uniref:alpha/beta hydrolase n=1 Tax=Kitasatospora sp. NPDC050543 TaxID=3364054 RepID=UPI0037A1A1A0
MDIPTLRDAKPSDLHGAADAYDQLDNAFTTHLADWRSGTANRVKNCGWTGDAADSANFSIRETDKKLHAAGIELTYISRVLRQGAEAFLLAQSQLQQALADAKTHDLVVHDDGQISWGPSKEVQNGDGLKELDRAKKHQAELISDRIAKALGNAAQADRTTAERLRNYTAKARTKSGLDLAGATSQQAVTIASFGGSDPIDAMFPKPDASPTEVNSWWKGLTPEEQNRLIEAHPERIGNRDGIPADVRDQANRKNLSTLIDQYRKLNPPSAEQKAKLEGFEAIKAKIDEGERNAAQRDKPKPYLIGIGDQGQGRAILSYGNPDTAQNVASYVPGTSTTLKGVGGSDADRAERIWESARGLNGKQSTASMVWLGYDAPPEIPDAADGGRAGVGAVSYQKFMQGLQATHQGDPAHVASVGHSYGSTVVGLAAQLPGGLAANDVVLVGSPGVGADNASKLSVGADHVWVGSGMVDPVTQLPSPADVAGGSLTGMTIGSVVGPWGTLGGSALGGVGGHIISGSDDRWFGKDPASEAFGGQRFTVDDFNPNNPADFAGTHSLYFRDQSLDNIGAIVVGDLGSVKREEKR